MEDQEVASSAAPSASLTLTSSGTNTPLKSLDDLDAKTLGTLIDDARRHEIIVQWFSIGAGVYFGSLGLGTILNLIPPGMTFLTFVLAAISLASTLGYVLSQHIHWIRECAELGMSRQQARDLRRRIIAARRQLHTKKRQMADEERVALVAQMVLGRRPVPAKDER